MLQNIAVCITIQLCLSSGRIANAVYRSRHNLYKNRRNLQFICTVLQSSFIVLQINLNKLYRVSYSKLSVISAVRMPLSS